MLRKALLLSLLVFAALFAVAAEEEKPAKFVFYFIGDGMGFEHLQMARDTTFRSAGTAMLDALPVRGAARTNNAEDQLTDSAAAATALACAVKTKNGMVGVDPDGDKLDSIAKLAKIQGRRVAIITSDAINGATPAAFYAHTESRKNTDEIARFLPISSVDFFGGGHFVATDETRSSVEKALADVGYTVMRDPADLHQAAYEDLPLAATHKWSYFEINRPADSKLPTLADYTAKAAELLGEHPAGFLIVVEAAKIDWASHTNDAPAAIGEVRELNRAVGKALDFYYDHPDDTVIVVTADHNTGNPQLAGPIPEELINNRKGSAFYAAELRKNQAYMTEPEKMMELLKDATAEEQAAGKELIAKGGPKLPEEFAALLQSQRDKRFGVTWGAKSHAPNPVPVLAIGRGAEIFEGEYENIEIPRKLFKLMGLIDPTE